MLGTAMRLEMQNLIEFSLLAQATHSPVKVMVQQTSIWVACSVTYRDGGAGQ